LVEDMMAEVQSELRAASAEVAAGAGAAAGQPQARTDSPSAETEDAATPDLQDSSGVDGAKSPRAANEDNAA
jgi:hypothetical protein